MIMNDLDFSIGDRVKVISKILKMDPFKTQNVWSTEMTGLVINIEAAWDPDVGKATEYIVSVWIDGGRGLWEFGLNYWKIRKLAQKED